jgi:hypothetical protein
MSQMTDLFPGAASSFGVLYPLHHVVALFRDGKLARRMGAELVAAGFPDEAVIDFDSIEFVSLVDAHRAHKGLWESFVEDVSRRLGTEAVYVDLDLARARTGAGVVAVLAKDDANKALARTILSSADPLAMRFYGAFGIEVFVEHSDTAAAQQDGES